MTKLTTAQRADLHRRLYAVGIEPCGDHGCIFVHAGGMGTNGGCDCAQGEPIELRRRLQATAAVLRECAALVTFAPSPTEARRPAAGWVEDRPGSQWSLRLGTITASVYAYRFNAVWLVTDGGEWATAATPDAGMLAAEDAAGRLLVAAIVALPNAAALLVEALAAVRGRR